jgi:G3E family GTPase
LEPGRILNLHARDLASGLALPASVTAPPPPAADTDDHSHCDHDHGKCDHDHEPDHDHAHGDGPGQHTHPVGRHDDHVSSFYISDDRPLDLKKIEAWFTEVIRVEGERVYRSKGILQIKGQPKRVIFQGVQMMFDARPDRLWNVGERRLSQLVFIGRDLDEARIRRGFADCIAS